MKAIFLSSLFLLVAICHVVRCEPPAPNYLHSQYDDQTYQLNEEVPLSHSHDRGHSHSHSHSHSGSHSAYDAPPSRGSDHEVVVQEYHHPISDLPTKVIQHGLPELDSSSLYRAPSSSSSYSKRRPVYHAPSHGHTSSSSYSHSRPKQLSSSSLSSYELPSKAEYTSSVRETSEPGYSSYKQNDYKGYSASSALAPVGSGDDYGVEAYSPSHGGDYGSPNTYQNTPLKSGGLSYSSPSSPSYSSPSVSHSPGYSSYSDTEYDPAPALAPVYRPAKTKTYRSPVVSHSHSSAYASPSASPYTSYGIPAKTATYGSPKGSSSILSSYGSPKLTYSKPVYAPPKNTYVSPTYSKGLHTSYRSPSSYYRSQKTSSYRSPVQTSYGAPSSKGFGYSYTPTDKGYEAERQVVAPVVEEEPYRYSEVQSSRLPYSEVQSLHSERRRHRGSYDSSHTHSSY